MCIRRSSFCAFVTATAIIGLAACTDEPTEGDSVIYNTERTFLTSAGDAVLEPAQALVAVTSEDLAAEWRRFAPSAAPELAEGEIGLIVTSGEDRGNSQVTAIRRDGDDLTIFLDVHELSDCGDNRLALIQSEALLVRVETEPPATTTVEDNVRDGCGNPN